ncbi:MAG: excinuclease ABC subunit UvrA [Verrucomicrobia bacterium]|nr:excinuclease ABC subunit UvrA [Verrucomicrobiota bacterium]MDA1085901.1 excinuclease ABC subunit UvrA [Verrucomicrobiota bacterium]
MTQEFISIIGASQNNLKNVDIKLPLGELIVVTGVSGSGKSSLAFDTIYAEGQRRYVETFSPYARQFLDRMDKPQAERIDGIPPAIAIDQTNPVRTSRSTVGTMTELNDHLKLLYARAAHLYCGACGAQVQRDSPDSIYRAVLKHAAGTSPHALITFPVPVPHNFSSDEVKTLLEKQGYTRFLREDDESLDVIQGRTALSSRRRSRIVEDLEAALLHGKGVVAVHLLNERKEPGEALRFSSRLHCAACDIEHRDPTPSFFSFNSPIGACDTCRGFGRTIGVDYDLVVPDQTLTLKGGAIKPFQSASYNECQKDLLRFAHDRMLPVDVPWNELSTPDREWVLEGEGEWDAGVWYGVSRFFRWLEGRAYRMHIRVLLSRYRAYRGCTDCGGARLKSESLLWRLGDRKLNLHDLTLLPIDQCAAFFRDLELPAPLDEATDLLLGEIRARLGYLVDVGLGYLTLDRQSRTLSGGEVQRINLTTALGTSLVNTLFVLDEPSIGLHPRDIRRLIEILHRLRDAGNTLIVVEHDPDVMRAADRILDMGPGPGERGGEVVFFGRMSELLKRKKSLTAQYLSGTRSARDPAAGRASAPSRGQSIDIVGASQHNLKSIDVSIPLNRLVCVTGVSGSGKSTLVDDVLHRGLLKLKHKAVESPGAHRRIKGHDRIGEIVMVDQSPIGKTTRSNPASYVGAFVEIRKIFSLEPLALERGYGPGTFSFNSGAGRCPTCSGNGFEHVEMQFLSDVYIRCPDCDGRRFRREVLDVTIRVSANGMGALSMADVLELTVSQACGVFGAHAPVLRALEPLQAVGLGYVKLGQPVPTLSGGEAQRLKLAGHLAKRGGRKKDAPTLFLFDEPTTGLHFEDTAVLLRALRRLIDAGHSVVVIEHNLDVIDSADWIVDLGPEGGDAGGEIVCAGTADDVAECRSSHTGQALRRARKLAAQPCGTAPPARLKAAESRARYRTARPNQIEVRHAREHNLRNINVRLPLGKFSVITGISGSGKSTLAFDIVFAEGQRRYLESLNAYARQFVQPASRPDVDQVRGIPPTVAIEQRTSRGGRKSTVATVTEVYHFLRLLFVKLGVQHCPDCDVPIEPQTPEAIRAGILHRYRDRTVQILVPLVVARKGYYTDLATWALGKGFSDLRVDGVMTPTAEWPRLDRFKEHDIELPIGQMRVTPRNEKALGEMIGEALDYGNGVLYALPVSRKREGRPAIFSARRACASCGRSFEELDPRLFSFNSKHGWCETCYGTGQDMSGFDSEQTGEERWWNEWWSGSDVPCGECEGRRLRPEALAVQYHGKPIDWYTCMPVSGAARFFAKLKLKGRELEVARDVIAELGSRLQFLENVGLGYLTLARSAPTLSGGEAQRIRLASQLGSNLRGVCYILDEPTIGLHTRDNAMLLDTLEDLKRKGNTVLVVEHDEDTIRRAEYVLDLGPRAGRDGGRVMAAGSLAAVKRCKQSLTGKFLRSPLAHPIDRPGRVDESLGTLTVKGADLHNLKSLDLTIPLGRLVCVTGVSGSGKSTLAREVIRANVEKRVGKKKRGRGKAKAFIGCREITGFDPITRVLEVDQAPIGKTPRSCPATYVGFWDDVRKLYAASTEARIRAYTPSRFSFNVNEGRCPACVGQGLKKIEMSFLPDVVVTCDECNGARFTPETLDILHNEKNIAEVLAMSVDEAVDFFENHASIHHALQLLQDVGLGYLTLGQQSPTLSGGEAQRIKLVTELAKCKPAAMRSGRASQPLHSLYVLDEPTIGLHMADVEKLIRVLHRLVDAGNTVIVIEHNLDVVAEADWVLDLGPEGGDGGGRIVAQGPPQKVARVTKRSHTGRALHEFLGDPRRVR